MPRIEADASAKALRSTSKSEASCVREMCFHFSGKEKGAIIGWANTWNHRSSKHPFYAAAKGTCHGWKDSLCKCKTTVPKSHPPVSI